MQSPSGVWVLVKMKIEDGSIIKSLRPCGCLHYLIYSWFDRLPSSRKKNPGRVDRN